MKIKKNNPDDLVFHYIVSFYKEMWVIATEECRFCMFFSHIVVLC
jgi:hypothetical protein